MHRAFAGILQVFYPPGSDPYRWLADGVIAGCDHRELGKGCALGYLLNAGIIGCFICLYFGRVSKKPEIDLQQPV